MKSAVSPTTWQKNILSQWQRFKGLCQEMTTLFKEQGFKAILARFGWKFLIIVFFYYLIRDVTLYILIPYFITKASTR
jgi:hypothetical protein